MCFSDCLRTVFPEFCYLTILSSSSEPNLSFNAYRYCLFGRNGFLLWHDLPMSAVRSPLGLLFSSLNRASPLRSSLHFFQAASYAPQMHSLVYWRKGTKPVEEGETGRERNVKNALCLSKRTWHQ